MDLVELGDVLPSIIKYCDLQTIFNLAQSCWTLRVLILRQPKLYLKRIKRKRMWLEEYFGSFCISFYGINDDLKYQRRQWIEVKKRDTFYISGDKVDYDGGYNELWQIDSNNKIHLVSINSAYDGYCGKLFLTIDDDIFDNLLELYDSLASK